MHPELQALAKGIEDAFRGMDAEQLTAHAGEKWSASEIAEHLSATYSGTAKALGRCVEAGCPSKTTQSMLQRLLTLMLVRTGYIPSGRKAPKQTLPAGLEPEVAISAFWQNLAKMDEVMTECEEKFGPSVKLCNHPVLGGLSLWEWRRFHVVHGQHHLKQILRLKRSPKRDEARWKRAAASR